MINNKETIIFDFDGTLVDTMQIFADVASHLMAENYGIKKEEARKFYFETSGLPFCKQLEVIFPEHKLNKVVSPVYETQKLDATQDIKMDDEVFEALKTLKDRGYNLIISSNNFQHNIDNFVAKNSLIDTFVLALGYKEEFGKGREHFDHIKEDLGQESSSMLFIGDSLNDYKLAQENKIDFVGKLGTFDRESFCNLDKNLNCITSIADLIK